MTTPDDLWCMVVRGEPENVLAAVNALTELERRALGPEIARRHKAGVDERLNGTIKSKQRNPKLEARQAEASAIALSGTASLTEMKSLGWRGLAFGIDPYEVLVARKPSWLPQWSEWVLEESFAFWNTVRRLYREGHIPRPETDRYVLTMANTWWARKSDILDRLREDPDLLHWEVWRLLELEGDSDLSLANHEKYSGPKGGWPLALKTLSEEGAIDRQRLLDVTLDVLERDFTQFRAGWYSRFHEFLSPTLDERAARTQSYLNLLGSRIPPTVSFALNSLQVLDKAKRLEPAAVVRSIGPALTARAKGTVLAALKVLEGAVKSDPALTDDAVYVIATALAHEAPEVQERALKLLEQFAASSNCDLGAVVVPYREGIAASQRARLHALTGGPAASPAPASPANPVPHPASARALTAEELWNKPRLLPEKAVQPVQSVQELIDLVANLMENEGPPDELERALDGIARLHREQPEGFEQLTAPLLKRTRHQLGRFTTPRLLLGVPVVAWLAGESTDKVNLVGPFKFMWERSVELRKPILKGTAVGLLSAPTHAGGWIDPRVFVERLHSRPELPKPDSPDLIQALYRLTPDARQEALIAAASLAGEAGEAVRHALGAKAVSVGETGPLWAAASRARAPLDDDPAVAAVHKRLGPDAVAPARAWPEWKSRSGKSYDGKAWVHWDVKLEVEPDLPSGTSPLLPTVLMYHSLDREGSAAGLRWLSLIWPANREGWSATGLRLIADNLDWWEAQWTNRVFLEPLLDPLTPLTGNALRLPVHALGAKEASESVLAVEVLIAGITEGRVEGATLGEMLADVAGTAGARLARWAKSLAQVARISDLHAAAVSEALERLAAAELHETVRAQDMAACMELLYELLVAQSQKVSLPEARAKLDPAAGGKLGKVAKALLAL